MAEFLEELLNDARKLIDPDLTITCALGVVDLKEILQLSVDAKIVLDIKKLLPISLSNFLGFLQLRIMFLFELEDQALILSTLVARIHRRGPAHFWRSVLSNLRSRKLKLCAIVKIVSLNFALRNLKQYLTFLILVVGQLD